MKNLLKIFAYFFGFIFILLLVAYATFSLLSFSKTVEVPDLRGKSLIEANDIITKKGLNLKITGDDYDSAIPPGYIIRQDMAAGSKVKEQRGIKVVVSRGAVSSSVPHVVGEAFSKAEALFMQKGLKIDKVIRVHSNAIEKDKVIAQKPMPYETEVHRVVLIISNGGYEEAYYCPNFVGSKSEDALFLADKLGLKLRITGSGGVIKSQRPAAGSQIKAGDMIYLQAGETK